MITPKRHPVITPFLYWYIRRKLHKHFHAIKVIGSDVPSDVPLLAIGNHISWWDGFFVLHLARNILHRNLYVMMLEEQLAANRILKYGGAFSIKKGSKSIMESLRFAKNLLNQKKSMVLVFPQGKFNSLYSDQFIFEKGLEYLLKNQSGNKPTNLLFIACLIEYGPNPKPTLFIHYSAYIPEIIEIEKITQEYRLFYQKCLHFNFQYISNL